MLSTNVHFLQTSPHSCDVFYGRPYYDKTGIPLKKVSKESSPLKANIRQILDVSRMSPAYIWNRKCYVSVRYIMGKNICLIFFIGISFNDSVWFQVENYCIFRAHNSKIIKNIVRMKYFYQQQSSLKNCKMGLLKANEISRFLTILQKQGEPVKYW